VHLFQSERLAIPQRLKIIHAHAMSMPAARHLKHSKTRSWAQPNSPRTRILWQLVVRCRTELPEQLAAALLDTFHLLLRQPAEGLERVADAGASEIGSEHACSL